VSKYIEW
jgi:hypothetical protein